MSLKIPATSERDRSRTFDRVWFWRCRLPERKGQRCRILVRSRRMNSILVEFEDGETVVTSAYAVRRVKEEIDG